MGTTSTSDDRRPGLFAKMHAFGKATLGGIPLWVVWVINGLAWMVFIVTGNNLLEFLMGLACLFALYVSHLRGSVKCMLICGLDVVWMWGWAFFGDSKGLLDLLDIKIPGM